jgi:hypothetical protein
VRSQFLGAEADECVSAQSDRVDLGIAANRAKLDRIAK